jgi:NTP pyrophosphatase (non-canonical NTP hydrolase)
MKMMDFNEYERKSKVFASYPNVGDLIREHLITSGNHPNSLKAFEGFIEAMSEEGVMNHPYVDGNPFYSALGLAGEAGEVSEKFKKILRNKKGVFSEEDKVEIKKELGDILWYMADICRFLDISLDDVAETNIYKLTDRTKRGVLHSSGDNR